MKMNFWWVYCIVVMACYIAGAYQHLAFNQKIPGMTMMLFCAFAIVLPYLLYIDESIRELKAHTQKECSLCDHRIAEHAKKK